jgi:esterase/lipase
MSFNHVFSFPAKHKVPRPRPLLVLVHGGALSHRMYRTVISILTNYGYDVAAVDLPGHGSAAKTSSFTFENATSFLSNAILQLKTASQKVLIIGVSLGGQVVLDLLQHIPELVDAAIVSGAPIHPSNEKAQWEMPHMPEDEEWIKIMTEDINRMGMENAQAVQNASFAFTFKPEHDIPPTLVVIGENDVAMAKRDFEELTGLVKARNNRSESKVLTGAWHNHPIDKNQQFAGLIFNWSEKIFGTKDDGLTE